MEDTKDYFELLADEIEKDLGEWDSIPETEADKKFKEKLIELAKEKLENECGALIRCAITQK